jgi:hypothetical protein
MLGAVLAFDPTRRGRPGNQKSERGNSYDERADKDEHHSYLQHYSHLFIPPTACLPSANGVKRSHCVLPVVLSVIVAP